MKRSREDYDKGESRLTHNDALAFLKGVKDDFQGTTDVHKYVGFLQLLNDYNIQKTDFKEFVSGVTDLFRGYPRLIYGLNTFLPQWFNIKVESDEPSLPSKKHKHDNEQQRIGPVDFVNKIKTIFRHDPSVYLRFLEILSMHRQKRTSIPEVYQEVSLLFLYHPDLIEDFTTFLPDPSLATTAVTNYSPPSLLHGRYLAPTTLRLWRPMHRYETKETNQSRKKKDDRDKEKFQKKASPTLQNVASTSRSDSRFCLPECTEELNPSYTFSPQNPKSATNNPDLELAAQVLNNSYISSASCASDERYTTQDEYGEDELFELDMLEESVKAAKKNAEVLLEKIYNATILPNSSFHIREHFTAQNFRCLGRIYKEEKWPIVMSELRENPIRVLPVVLARLGQKEEELKQYRVDFRSKFQDKICNKISCSS